jgi:ABC-2 type transport system permease protein
MPGAADSGAHADAGGPHGGGDPQLQAEAGLMRALRFLLRKEFLQIFRDKMIVRMVFVLPMVQLLLLSNAASFEIKGARFHLLDHDHSPMSRGLVNHLTASGRFELVDATPSLRAADRAMLAREIDLTVVIPDGFEEGIVRGKKSSVQLIMNAEDGAGASVTHSYAARTIALYSQELSAEVTPMFAAMQGRHEIPPQRGMPLIEVHRRAWYNPTLNYKHFMVPGILVVLVTMVGTLLTAMNIVREKEAGTLDQLNVTPISRPVFIAAKLLPLWLLAMFDFAMGLVLARLVFGVPWGGNPLVVVLAAGIYLIGALGIGLWISAIVETQQQAMFVTVAILMVYLLMSGLFTPVRAMPEWGQLVAQASPVMHFTSLIRAVLLKGAGLADVLHELMMLTIIGSTVLTLAVRQYSKRSR